MATKHKTRTIIPSEKNVEQIHPHHFKPRPISQGNSAVYRWTPQYRVVRGGCLQGQHNGHEKGGETHDTQMHDSNSMRKDQRCAPCGSYPGTLLG